MMMRGSLVAIVAVVAMAVAANGLPDLILDEAVTRNTMAINTMSFSTASCAYQEGCVTGTGQRRLLRFSTATANIGTTDLYIGAPSGNFVYDPCHGHYHFNGFAEYRMFRANTDVEATRGRKAAFCLMDSSPYPGWTGGARGHGGYHCGNQGISKGYQDIYYSGLDCQWIDVTDVPDGMYDLQITLNVPDPVTGQRKFQEERYDNNLYRIPVTITGSGAGGGSTQCQVGQWSAWSPCSQPCGGTGSQIRSRTATGFNCPDASEERFCNLQPCGDGYPISEDGRCGNNSPVAARCPGTECCSQYGWCGTSAAHCTNQQEFDDDNGSNDDGGNNNDDGGNNNDDGGNNNDDGGNNNDDGGNNNDDGGNNNGDGSNGHANQCQGCWPGTSGFCKGANGVCYNYFPGTTMCPGGTDLCGDTLPDIDCEVEPWSAWGDCDVECGGGIQSRRRIVLRPQQSNGAPCPDELFQSRSCNVDACDDGNGQDGNTDCVVSSWGAWGDCDVQCGGGTAVRRRTVVIAPTGTGQACPSLEESRSCNPESCDIDDDEKCDSCFPGTSGPCQTPDSVCWAFMDVHGVPVCPAGATRCYVSGSVTTDPAVNFHVTLGDTDTMSYMESANNVRETMASVLGVLPQAVRVKAVTGTVAVGDEHTGRRLHGGAHPVAGQHLTTLEVEIVAPQHFDAEPMSASALSSRVQKAFGDDIVFKAMVANGVGTKYTIVDPADVTIADAGSPTNTAAAPSTTNNGDNSGSGSGSALITPAMAVIVAGSAFVGAVIAMVALTLLKRRNNNGVTTTKVRSYRDDIPKPRSFKRVTSVTPAGLRDQD